MRIGTLMLLAPALAAFGGAASANAQDARYAYAAIEAGKLTQAERALERETRAGSREPEILLNLAAIYAKTERPDAARALYGQVLSGDDASLILPSHRIASAHDVARRGLRMLEQPGTLQLTAR